MEQAKTHDESVVMRLINMVPAEYLAPSKFNARMKDELVLTIVRASNICDDVIRIVISYLVNNPYMMAESQYRAIYHERLNGAVCGVHIYCVLSIALCTLNVYGKNKGESYRYSAYNIIRFPPVINGIANGMYVRYHNDGNISESCTYVNSVMHGKREMYHENGRLAKLCYYVNDKLHGDCREWHENGRPKSYRSYRNGKRVG